LQLQISSALGFLAIRNQVVDIPDIVASAAHLVKGVPYLQRADALDELCKLALPTGVDSLTLGQTSLVDEWWNHLDTAAFPARTVCISLIHSNFCDYLPPCQSLTCTVKGSKS
jgi:hypothetical protein